MVIFIPIISLIILIEVEEEATMPKAEAEVQVHLQVSSITLHYSLKVLTLEQRGQFAKYVEKPVI